MAGKLDEYPHLKRRMQQREREAQLEHVQDWLDGRVTDPALNHDPNPKPFEMEVGEKRPEPDGELHDGPGLTVIRAEDDGMVEKLPGGATRLVPGKGRVRTTAEYQRRR